MKEQERIEQLIEKVIAGEASLEEEKYVQHYFNQNHQYKEWDAYVMGDKSEVKNNLKEKIAQSLNQRKAAKTILQKLLPVMKIAAAILLVCLGGWYMNRQEKANIDYTVAMQEAIVPGSDKGSLTLSNGVRIDIENLAFGESVKEAGVLVSKNEAGELTYSFLNDSKNTRDLVDQHTANTLVTPLGGRLTIVLADGTKVWMNSGSTLVFPNVFSTSEREVTITGEAYFQVSKNEHQPFIVHTNKTQIKVLGTEFNINAYANEEENVTTLIEGSIQLQTSNTTQRVFPGQQVIMNQDSDMTVKKADIETITAWKDNNFIFKNQNIKTIMKEISRWYDVEVEYKGNMDNKFFDVFVSRRKNIEEILSIIELTESVHFKIEGRRILVME